MRLLCSGHSSFLAYKISVVNNALIACEELTISLSHAVSEGWIEKGSVFLKTKTERRVFQYPGVWIRDNCQCPKCFDKSSQNRKIVLKDLNVEVKPNQVEVQKEQVGNIEIFSVHYSVHSSI